MLDPSIPYIDGGDLVIIIFCLGIALWLLYDHYCSFDDNEYTENDPFVNEETLRETLKRMKGK